MANVLIEEQVLIDIADAIRENLYSDDTYKPAVMPDKIEDVYNKGFEDGKAEGSDEQWISYLNGTLVDAVVPEGITKLAYGAFYGSSIKTVILPEGLEIIGDSAFGECFALATITLPNSLKVIGNDAFAYCYRLKMPILPEGLKAIGECAFDSCGSFSGELLFPSTLEALEGSLFGWDGAPISSVRFKGIQTQISSWAFGECYDITTIKVPWSEEHPLSADAPWGAPNATVIYDYIGDLIIPEGVTEIGAYEFIGETTIETVTFPSTLKLIGYSAFDCCINLQTPILPEGLEVIEESAFYDCSSFEGEFVFPSTIKEVECYIFGDGYSDGVWLDALVFKGTPTRIDECAFDGANVVTTIKVPWSEGDPINEFAPWGAYDATIYYNWTEEE